nr:putative small nuclear ribonucleoprotein G [Cryptomonas curvata]
MQIIKKNNTKLDSLIDKKVSVYLRINERIEGTLIGFDQFLNLVLENSILLIENKKKILGTILIRGNNVNSIEE